jgi:hypothetical protein
VTLHLVEVFRPVVEQVEDAEPDPGFDDQRRAVSTGELHQPIGR